MSQLTRDIIYKIREEILKDKSKFQLVKEFAVSLQTVYRNIKDLPNKYKKQPYISSKPFGTSKTTH